MQFYGVSRHYSTGGAAAKVAYGNRMSLGWYFSGGEIYVSPDVRWRGIFVGIYVIYGG